MSTAETLKGTWDTDTWIAWLKESKQRHIQIIGEFAEELSMGGKLDIRNYDQGQVFIKRHLRAAKDLSPFDEDQIARATREVLRADYSKWTLDTVLKHLV